MFMRVALGIHGDNIKGCKTYDASEKYFIHATPHYLTQEQNDSIEQLFPAWKRIQSMVFTLKDCSLISKWAGGIGLHVHNIRAKSI